MDNKLLITGGIAVGIILMLFGGYKVVSSGKTDINELAFPNAPRSNSIDSENNGSVSSVSSVSSGSTTHGRDIFLGYGGSRRRKRIRKRKTKNKK